MEYIYIIIFNPTTNGQREMKTRRRKSTYGEDNLYMQEPRYDIPHKYNTNPVCNPVHTEQITKINGIKNSCVEKWNKNVENGK